MSSSLVQLAPHNKASPAEAHKQSDYGSAHESHVAHGHLYRSEGDSDSSVVKGSSDRGVPCAWLYPQYPVLTLFLCSGLIHLRPVKMSRKVVLPLPLGPIIPTREPGLKYTLMSFSMFLTLKKEE